MKEAGKNFQIEDQKKEEYNKQHSIDQVLYIFAG
jgi:hypothetical protein